MRRGKFENRTTCGSKCQKALQRFIQRKTTTKSENCLPRSLNNRAMLPIEKNVFTLHPVRELDSSEPIASGRVRAGLHSHYIRLTRIERYAYRSPCSHCVCIAPGCDHTLTLFLSYLYS